MNFTFDFENIWRNNKAKHCDNLFVRINISPRSQIGGGAVHVKLDIANATVINDFKFKKLFDLFVQNKI